MKVALGLLLDLVALGGVSLAVYGVALVSVPAAFVAGGLALTALGLAGARKVAKL